MAVTGHRGWCFSLGAHYASEGFRGQRPMLVQAGP